MKTKTPTKPLKSYLAQWRVLELTLFADTELCRELDIHPTTSRRWRREGKIPFLIIQRQAFYRMCDVLPFLCRKLEDQKLKKEVLK